MIKTHLDLYEHERWPHLHVSVVQRISHVMGVDRTDPDVPDRGHHSFHCNRGDCRVSGRPAEVPTPSSRLKQTQHHINAQTTHHTHKNIFKLYFLLCIFEVYNAK